MFDADASVQLSNTIIAGDAPSCTGAGPFTSAGNNISTDASCSLTGTGDQQNTDPKLGPLADNGGPTQTHALLEGITGHRRRERDHRPNRRPGVRADGPAGPREE